MVRYRGVRTHVCGVVLVALNVELARILNQANDYRNQLMRQVSVWYVVW